KYIFFFFQAEDGIRDFHVTGVQTCALPICRGSAGRRRGHRDRRRPGDRPASTGLQARAVHPAGTAWSVSGRNRRSRRLLLTTNRSEERRVGKECEYGPVA